MSNRKIEMLMNEVINATSAYAKAYNEGEKAKKLKALKKAATDAVNEYNLALSWDTYRRWAAEGEAVKTALRTLYVPGAIKAQYKTDDDDYMTVVIKDLTTYEVSLPQMQACLGAGVFSDPAWFNYAEKLAFLTANALNERLNDSALFKYNIAEASRTFQFPDGCDPLSESGVVHALQKCMDAILFLPSPDSAEENLIKTRDKVDSHGHTYSVEWQYIRESMTANGGVGKVTVCNTGRFTSYILHVMHVILTNGTIGLESDGDFEMPKAEAPAEAPADAPADAQAEDEE